MKTTLRILLLAFCVTHLLATAAGQNIEWITSYGTAGNSGWNGGLKMVLGNEKELFVTGRVGAPTIDMDGHVLNVQGESDVVLAKLDSLGNVVWATNAGGSCFPTDAETGIHISYMAGPQDRVVIVGNYMSQATFGAFTLPGGCNNNEIDMFVAAYDTSGTCVWAKGARSRVRPSAMLVGPTTDVHVFGTIDLNYVGIFIDTPNVVVQAGAFRAKYNYDGDLVKAERIMINGKVSGASWDGDDMFLSGHYSDNDSLWNMPLTAQVSGRQEGFLARTDTAGNVSWLETITGSEDVRMGKCVLTPSGKFYAYGLAFNGGDIYLPSDTISLPVGQFSGFIVHYDENQQFVWGLGLDCVDHFGLLGLAYGPDEDIYAMGQFGGTMNIGPNSLVSNASKEIYVLRLDSLANLKSALRVGRTQPAGAGSIIADESGFYLSGPFDSTMVWATGPTLEPSVQGKPDLFVVKLNELSGFTGTKTIDAPDRKLVVYANPNKGTCNVDLPHELKTSQNVVLSIYSATGALVERFNIPTNSNVIRLNLKSQSRGFYQLILSDGKVLYTGTVVFE